MKKDTTKTAEGSKQHEKVPAKRDKGSKKGQLTATQLRNARKRRAKKAAAKQQQQNAGIGGKKSAPSSPSSRHHQQHQDPSLRYISNPRQAPIVQRAIQFFASQQPGISHFPVVLTSNNKQEGWRTVAKLAVRADRQGGRIITIGLFAPGSHQVLDCATTCPAHHPSINRAVQRLQEICRHENVKASKKAVIIPAYCEQSGTGCFRYVQCQVERATGAVQITLVWRKDLQHDAALQYLCQEIIASSSSSGGDNNGFVLHSLWVHYNNAWKHNNSIVSRSSAGVKTTDCSVDNLSTMGQDGSWVHVVAAATTKDDSASSSSRKDDDEMFSGGVVVERLESVLSDQQDWDPGDSESSSSPRRKRRKRLLSVPLHFAPNVFRQANLDGFMAIVARIRSYLLQQQHASNTINLVELYGGVGTIGLHLADLCTSLVCSDENPYNHACFQAGVRGMEWSSASSSSSSKKKKHKKKYKDKKTRDKIDDDDDDDGNSNSSSTLTAIRYEPKSATAMVQDGSLLCDADWIVVDPPRKGLDDGVIQALCRNYPHHEPEQQQHRQQVLVYVSCGFEAFVRDFRQLTTTGKRPWKLHQAEGHILFPGSDAIETLAFFTR